MLAFVVNQQRDNVRYSSKSPDRRTLLIEFLVVFHRARLGRY